MFLSDITTIQQKCPRWLKYNNIWATLQKKIIVGLLKALTDNYKSVQLFLRSQAFPHFQVEVSKHNATKSVIKHKSMNTKYGIAWFASKFEAINKPTGNDDILKCMKNSRVKYTSYKIYCMFIDTLDVGRLLQSAQMIELVYQ